MSDQKIEIECSNPLCPARPRPKHKGFCLSCYRYQLAHGGEMRPPKVIERGERKKKWDKRKPSRPKLGKCDCDETAVAVKFIQVRIHHRGWWMQLCGECLEKENRYGD